MNFKQVLIVIVFCLLFFNFFPNCNNVPKNYLNLDVPYHEQACKFYCGVACIQMWAHFDGWATIQEDIAEYVGATYQRGAHPSALVSGVGYYTCSEGHFILKSSFIPGAQGDLVAATINGIKDYRPSIMPWHEDHAILVKGYEWKEDIVGRPVAKEFYFHNPDGLPNRQIAASTMRICFVPCPWEYWVIVAYAGLEYGGVDGHDEFIMNRGYLYGGPQYYNPKGLSPYPSTL